MPYQSVEEQIALSLDNLHSALLGLDFRGDVTLDILNAATPEIVKHYLRGRVTNA